jgi:hypothetical protein
MDDLLWDAKQYSRGLVGLVQDPARSEGKAEQTKRFLVHGGKHHLQLHFAALLLVDQAVYPRQVCLRLRIACIVQSTLLQTRYNEPRFVSEGGGEDGQLVVL